MGSYCHVFAGWFVSLQGKAGHGVNQEDEPDEKFINNVCMINLIRLLKLINFPEKDIICTRHFPLPSFGVRFFEKEFNINIISFTAGTDILVTNWTKAEHHLGIVSDCLPGFWPLFHSIHGVFSIHHTTSSNDKSSPSQTAQPPSGTDTYKTLNGKEMPMYGFNIALVPCDQWTVPPTAPILIHDRNNVINIKAVIEWGVPRPRDDVELGLSPQKTNVPHEVDISSRLKYDPIARETMSSFSVLNLNSTSATQYLHTRLDWQLVTREWGIASHRTSL